MTKKLVVIILAAAALAAGLFALCRLAFPEILSYTPGEAEIVSWQRQAVFLIEAIAWMSAEVSGLFAILLAAHVWKQSAIRSS